MGDTPSSIAEKTGVPLEDILRLNPDLDPQTLQPGPADQAAPVSAVARTAAAVVAAAALLLGRARAALARDCPPAVKAPNAIVLEVSTGEVACERAADQRRPVGSAVKLMTALLTLERAELSRPLPGRRTTGRPPAESQIGLRPGERMSVRDLLRGPARRVRQRRGDDARRRRLRAPSARSCGR